MNIYGTWNYLDTLDVTPYKHELFEPTDAGIESVIRKSHSDFFGKAYAGLKLPYDKYKPLADEFSKAMKLGEEPNFIPLILNSNGYKLTLSSE